MLKIHTSDGQTVCVDLRDESQAKAWLRRLEQDKFQAQISGASLVAHHEAKATCPACGCKHSAKIGVQYSLSRPQGHDDIRYEAERVEVGDKHVERILVTAGDSMLSVVAHESQPSARIVMVRSGKRRFTPKHY